MAFNTSFSVTNLEASITSDTFNPDFIIPSFNTSKAITTESIIILTPTLDSSYSLDRLELAVAIQELTFEQTIVDVELFRQFNDQADTYEYTSDYIYYGWEDFRGENIIVIRRRDRDSGELQQATDVVDSNFDSAFSARISYNYQTIES